MSRKSKQETSYGIIPIRFAKDRWQTFLIKQVHGHFWGFPKGHPNEGEKPLDAAIRELEEETSLTFKEIVLEEIFSESYTFFHKGIRIEKNVEYFVVEVEGAFKAHPTEIEEGEWLDIDAALKRLTYPESKRILTEVKNKLPKHLV